MNKKTIIIICAAIVCIAIVGCALAGVFDGFGQEKVVNDDNTFIVGFDAEFPPYGFKADNGSYVGFDLDLAQEVAKRNNWTFVAQPIDWDSKDAELQSGSNETAFCDLSRGDKSAWHFW